MLSELILNIETVTFIYTVSSQVIYFELMVIPVSGKSV